MTTFLPTEFFQRSTKSQHESSPRALSSVYVHLSLLKPFELFPLSFTLYYLVPTLLFQGDMPLLCNQDQAGNQIKPFLR